MLSIRNLHFSVKEKHILQGIDLDVNDYEVISISGPSGVGKTTLIKCILGLYEPSFGTIYNDNVLLSKDNKIIVPPEKRNFGVVFQDHLLIPFYNVYENITLGLSKKFINDNRDYFDHLIDILKISNLIDRNIQGISGGEQQRVSIARALIRKPKVLIMDEPFSNVDDELKKTIILGIRKLLTEFKSKTILITHNFDEARMLTKNHYMMTNRKLDTILK